MDLVLALVWNIETVEFRRYDIINSKSLYDANKGADVIRQLFEHIHEFASECHAGRASIEIAYFLRQFVSPTSDKFLLHQ
jgi:hypothetical protein